MEIKKLNEELEKVNKPVDLMDVDNIPSDILSVLEDIAKEYLDIDTLKTRNSDSLDFHDVSVWSLATALYQAYSLGVNSIIE